MGTETEGGANLRKLAKNRRFEELETAAVEAIEAGTVDREEIVSVLTLTSHRAETEQVDTLFWILTTTFEEKHGAEAGLDLARDLAPLLPRSALFREEAASLYQRVHGDRPDLPEILARTLSDPKLPTGDAVKIADGLLEFAPGRYAARRGRKEPGLVEGLCEGGLSLRYVDRTEVFPLGHLEVLRTVPEDDFRALAAFEPDLLAREAEEDPVALVERVLRAEGPELNYRDLRGHLVGVVPGSFADWWNEVRNRIASSAWIEMSPGRQPSLQLRKIPVAPSERVEAELAGASGPGEGLLVILEYLDRAGSEASEDIELARTLDARLREDVRAEPAPLALAALAVLDQLREVVPELAAEPLPPLPEMSGDPSDVMAALPDSRLVRGALDLVRSTDPEGWIRFFAEALPGCPGEMCDYVARELLAAGEGESLLVPAAKIMHAPNRFPEALAWVLRACAEGDLPEASRGGPDPTAVMEGAISALDRSARAAGTKNAAWNRLRTALSAKNWLYSRRMIERTDREGARRIRDTVERSPGLPDPVRSHLGDLLAEVHPEVFAKSLPPWKREDVIYSTRMGLDRKNEEYGVLVNERLPAVAEAIGRAAAFGDLSENAEYTAALEERDRLTERANSLKADLDRATILPPEMPQSETVTVGSRVKTFSEDTGQEETFCFLGPWDVDVDNRIFSYRAPFSLVFMGRREGDIVEAPGEHGPRRYRILEVTSALE